MVYLKFHTKSRVAQITCRDWHLFNVSISDLDLANYLGGQMSELKGSGEERESSLAGSYPIRAPVWWGRRGEPRPHPELPGVSGRFILLCHPKSFRRFEGFLAKLLHAPKELRRPLDEMNSLLWELSNGHRTFEEIVSLMDETFTEQVAPAVERTEAALRLLGERGFLLFSKTEFEDVWLTGPGIEPSGGIIHIDGVDTSAIEGDEVE